MTPVALRGRGTTSTYNCFPATGLYFKSKVLASVGRGSTETTRLQHGSSLFGDTHAKGGDVRKRRGPSFVRFKLKIPDQTQADFTRLDYIFLFVFSFGLDG